VERLVERGLIHGGMGRATKEFSDLVNQQMEQAEFARKKAGGQREGEAKFTEDEPPLRQRRPPRRPPVSDEFEDIELQPLRPQGEGKGEEEEEEEEKRPIGRTNDPPPFIVQHTLRKKVGDRPPERPGDQPRPDDQPQPQPRPEDTIPQRRLNQGETARPDLRPEFEMLGTDFFDKLYGIAPLGVENSEWTEFDFVDVIDRRNYIQTDDVMGEKIRFSEPLFYPKYQAPLAPPSKLSVGVYPVFCIATNKSSPLEPKGGSCVLLGPL